jgi:trans-2,3-dihydro-3-hydroxyanthranilate isomerase
MRRYRFLQLDVFTERSFCGNPLAVFPEAEGLSDEEMQSIAREMNLSETVFVLPSNDERALRRLRIFTPATEIPMAGHPVVGTWNALAREEGIVPKPADGNGWTSIMHEIGIGVLPVDIEFSNGQPARVVMTQGKFSILNEISDDKEKDELAQALGLKRDDFDERLPIQIVSTGLPSIATPLKSLDALGRCRVNSSLLSEINLRNGAACYVFTLETREGGPSQAHSRLFAPEHNIAEDPATGSAAGALSGYLVHHGALDMEAAQGIYGFVIEQGDFMKRPSRIHAEVTGAKGNVEKVRVGGPSVVVAVGEVIF